ncbi:MAG: hypothetical protein IKV76_04790 [Clostridia bacterium]|nr:hypothetical protein [Clostridia bacterium]
MRKAITFLLCLLFTMTILFPVGALVSACFGYTFELTSFLAVSVIIAVISVFTVIFSIISKDKIINKGIIILSYILFPLSFINAVIYIFESGELSVTICVFVSAVCCFCVTIRNIDSKVGKIIVSVLFSMMTAFFIFFAFMMLTFGSIGQNTVIKNIESPNGNFYAQVIDSDQGAFGGDTLVNVYEKRGIDTFIFRLKDKPQRVYLGEWREYESMHISWKDDKCLVINSVEYEIE